MNWLNQRLQEPSTHAGLSGLAGSLALFFPQYQAVFGAIAAVFGALGAASADKGA